LRNGFIFELQCGVDIEADYELIAVALDDPRLVITVTVEEMPQESGLGAVVCILPGRDELELAF
jgi:hypothetical protein